MPDTIRVTFQPASAFHADVKARVERHFQASGRSWRGGWRLALESAAILGWFLASYLLLLLGHPARWQAAHDRWLERMGRPAEA